MISPSKTWLDSSNLPTNDREGFIFQLAEKDYEELTEAELKLLDEYFEARIAPVREIHKKYPQHTPQERLAVQKVELGWIGWTEGNMSRVGKDAPSDPFEAAKYLLRIGYRPDRIRKLTKATKEQLSRAIKQVERESTRD